MNALDPALAQLRLQRPPGEVEPWAVEERAAAGRIGHPDQNRGRVGEQPEPPLTLLEGVLGADAVGDILSVAEHAGRLPALLVADVPVHPDPLRPILRDEAHEPAVHGVGADPLEVGVDLVLDGR